MDQPSSSSPLKNKRLVLSPKKKRKKNEKAAPKCILHHFCTGKKSMKMRTFTENAFNQVKNAR